MALAGMTTDPSLPQGATSERARRCRDRSPQGTSSGRPRERLFGARIRRKVVVKQASELGVIWRREADEQDWVIRLKERTD
jgi:hypothetical protein